MFAGLLVSENVLKKLRNICGVLRKQKNRTVDEGLGTYFEHLGNFNRKLWWAEELYLRKFLQITRMNDIGLNELKLSEGN